MISLVQYLINESKKKKEVPYNGFAILKPGFLDIQDDFEQLLEDNDWTISDVTIVKLPKDVAKELYEPHKEKDFYNDLCDYMSSDKCICYLLHKDCEDPIEDLKEVKEEARKKWGKDDMKNCMHSSDSKENVERESKICMNINYEQYK